MKPRHQVSRAAIELIKRFEGYRRKAAQLPDGRWTLGYGHVLSARQGAEVSEEDAEALLLYDLIVVAHAVNELTLAPLNQNQFDALCSFVFNIGVEDFRGSTALRRLNEGQPLQAAAYMEMWRKAEVAGELIVIDALVRRRAAEKLLFLTPVDGWVPAPSAILVPHIDLDAVEALPLKTPAQVIVSLEGEYAVAVREDAPPVEVRASASERAVAAVGARLQRIFPEPEANAAPALRLTPAPEFDTAEPEPPGEAVQEAQDGPTLFDVARDAPEPAPEPEPTPLPVILPIRDKPATFAPRGPNWAGLVAPIALAVVGVVLTGAALFWGVYDGSEALGLNRRAVIWVGGLAGVSMMAFSAYLTLRRLSDMEDGEA
jgi:lysozyme